MVYRLKLFIIYCSSYNGNSQNLGENTIRLEGIKKESKNYKNTLFDLPQGFNITNIL